jgi:putative ABC transport system ATP-binding protein
MEKEVCDIMTAIKEDLPIFSKKSNTFQTDAEDNIIKMVNVSRTYHIGNNRIDALSGINLTIKKGEMLVILGPSGSGKTTLLNLAGGIDLPTDGRIYVDNIELSNKKQMEKVRKEKIGFIFQFFNLLPNLTARENVEYVLELIKSKKNRQKAQEYMKLVGLEKRENHFPSQLSGGEQQRVAIARALAKNPLVILADEPTGELDVETGIKILQVLYSLVKKYNKTVIIVTHNQEIAKIADRIIKLSSGTIKVVEDNSSKRKNPEELSW